MIKALIIVGVLLSVVLLAGCTQSNAIVVGSLADMPNISAGGLNELGSLPSVNQSVSIGSGLPSSNPFPDQPILQ